MAPRYRVTLTKEEREELEVISTKGKRAARTVLYARRLSENSDPTAKPEKLAHFSSNFR